MNWDSPQFWLWITNITLVIGVVVHLLLTQRRNRGAVGPRGATGPAGPAGPTGAVGKATVDCPICKAPLYLDVKPLTQHDE